MSVAMPQRTLARTLLRQVASPSKVLCRPQDILRPGQKVSLIDNCNDRGLPS